MGGTYARLMEGTPETASPYILKSIDRTAAEMLSPATPLFVLRPAEMPLLPLLCVAEFVSPRGVHETDPDYRSRLYICWFTRYESTAESLDFMIKEVLPFVDWEGYAEDYNICF